MVASDNKGTRMKVSSVAWAAERPEGVYLQHIEVDTAKTFQKFEGIGGAFTDAAMVNLRNTSDAARAAVLDAYYAAGGAGYTMGRVPVASCDFSTHSYSYIEDGDYALDTFNLTEEDTGPNGKIDLIHGAQKRVAARSGAPLQLFASAWTAPPFLKENGAWVGGALKADAKSRDTWAAYLARFVTEYGKRGVDLWGMTLQNEPTPLPKIVAQTWESMPYTPAQQGEFLARHLGPAMRAAHPSLKLIVHDDNKAALKGTVEAILKIPNASQYIDGVGVHWYVFPTKLNAAISETQALLDAALPGHDCFILGTEACSGFATILSPPKRGVDLGNWERGQQYGADVLGDLNAGAVGWTDWNLVLDMNGGPNHVGNNCDAPIVIDTATPGRYYKQPMYYFLAHYAAYITRGSRRVGVDSQGLVPMEVTGWKRPDGRVVLVVLNRDYALGRSFTVHDPKRGYLVVHVEPASVATLVY
eukprot:TRINITY_DN7106_c0_g1_i2.p1 TRINITY_DN7106_c0_g1~~TRINITY_DN7106_c0_g1_i2.p1  ORF type:complete len:544 (+),score=189.34 TRINITY_DN7106_c0_g1_i2:219-1634(+)